MRQPIFSLHLIREHAPIQPQTVRAALDTLLYSAAARRFIPLEHLWLVDAYLLDPENALSPNERLLALQTVLINIITTELARHRVAIQQPASTPEEDLPTALAAVSSGARTENIELIAWSWLYYRFVRVDLQITPVLFCEHAHCDERTRRRYHVHGVRRLTERLIEREREARRMLCKHRLYAELPTLFSTALFGRTDLMEQARRWFGGSTPLLMQISGAAGVGKTAFVTELLRSEIDVGRITELIWIDRPASPEQVLEVVKERLPPGVTTPGNPFVNGSGIVLVLDDLSLLETDLPAFNRLLTGLTPLTICLLHRVTLPVMPLSLHVHLDGLSLLETNALVHWLENRHVQRDMPPLSDSDVLLIWETSRGVPSAVLSEFAALMSGD